MSEQGFWAKPLRSSKKTSAEPGIERLTKIVVLTHKIGILYDEAVKVLNTYHLVATAQRMISKLETYSQALIRLQEQALQLTKDFEQWMNRKLTNHNLEALTKQLYDYWFVQFDFPDKNGNPYKSSDGAMVWNDDLKREIPEAWNSGVFSEVANITMGQSPDGSSYNEDGEGTIFYQGSTDFGVRFRSVRMYTTSPSRFANRGDILMSVRAPVGAVNIANADCCIGRGLSAISSKISSITYIYYVVNYLRIRFDSLNTSGTTFGSITKDELLNLPVVVPSNDVIERFESICKPIFDKQMEIGFVIEQLTKLRNELLPLLMNGQVSPLNCD